MKYAAIFLMTQYGVVVELRQWGERDMANAWLDRYATEWVRQPDGSWVSQSFNKITAAEIGRWSSATGDIRKVLEAADNNESGFRNWGE